MGINSVGIDGLRFVSVAPGRLPGIRVANWTSH
jgi:hypothetical protein